MSVIDFKAAHKWSKIPKFMQERLLSNVFCSVCGVTTIVDFSMHNDKFVNAGINLTFKRRKRIDPPAGNKTPVMMSPAYPSD